jgi:hypothetical protein
MASKQATPQYGKYRGKVVDNVDPLFLGRIIAESPALPATRLDWALPCTPYAGPGIGLYAVPPIGANVWIEFEGGDPDYPIWTGCFWGEGELPFTAQPPMPFTKMLKTDGVRIIVNDAPGVGGLTIECTPPAVADALTLTLNSSGMALTCGATTFQLTPDLLNIVGQMAISGGLELTGAMSVSAITATGPIEAAGGIAISGAGTVNGAPLI